MGMLGGDPRRSSARPTDIDRLRSIELLRAQHAEGRLSSLQLDEGMEAAWSAASLADLDALTAGMRAPANIDPELLLAQAMPAPTRSKWQQRSFLERQLLYGGAFLVFWIVVWALTGGGAVWLALIFVGSATGLAFRLARGERRKSGLLGGSRRSLRR